MVRNCIWESQVGDGPDEIRTHDLSIISPNAPAKLSYEPTRNFSGWSHLSLIYGLDILNPDMAGQDLYGLPDGYSFHLIEHPIDGSKSFSILLPSSSLLMLFIIVFSVAASPGAHGIVDSSVKRQASFESSNRNGSGVHIAPYLLAVSCDSSIR